MNRDSTARTTGRVIRRCLGLIVAFWCLTGCRPLLPPFDYASLEDPRGKPYRLGPGDSITVRVINDKSASGTYYIRPDGHLTMPLAGELFVTGLTIHQVKQRIVARVDKHIEDAAEKTSVALDKWTGLSYSVVGEVNQAGRFTMQRYHTVLEGLAEAHGLTPYAQRDEIYVLRSRIKGKTLQIPVDYDELVKNPSKNRNFYLLAGDVVVVP